MNRYSSVIAGSLAMGLVLLAATHSRAEWKLPNLNPFAKQASSADSGRFKAAGPARANKSHVRPATTPWQKFNQGAKSFLTKTRDTLNPWSKSKKTAAQGPRGGAQKASFFAPFKSAGGEPQEKPINGVNDWLSLPRPSP